ncbi:hypothetical protein M0804_004324 [Polistes exclamans]|nr:hypothetical protein M0804_004324 [Polistes exclamans]
MIPYVMRGVFTDVVCSSPSSRNRLSPPQPPNGPQDILPMYGQYFFVRTEEGRGERYVSSPGWPSPAITTSPWDTPTTKRVALRAGPNFRCLHHGEEVVMISVNVIHLVELTTTTTTTRTTTTKGRLKYPNGFREIIVFSKLSTLGYARLNNVQFRRNPLEEDERKFKTSI